MKEQATIEASSLGTGASPLLRRIVRPSDAQRLAIAVWIVAAWICAGAVSALSVVGAEHETQSFFRSDPDRNRTTVNLDPAPVQPLRYDSLVYHVSGD